MGAYCGNSLRCDAKHTFVEIQTYDIRSEEHTSELQSQSNLVCRLLLEKKNIITLVQSQAIPFITVTVSIGVCFDCVFDSTLPVLRVCIPPRVAACGGLLSGDSGTLLY